MKFKNKFKTIFLDKNSLNYNVNNFAHPGQDKVNIILSPSMYWVKKLSLPVKYVREVKKLLPSIFEDTLPEGKYSYTAYKSGDQFFAFAYEDKVILDTIQEKGIPSSNIANVYFAQSELENFEGALKINETQSIYIKDELLIQVPCCWVHENGDLDVSEITLSKHKVPLQHFSHIVDNKSLYKIGAIILIFILLVFGEYYITLNKTAQITQQKDELFSKYNLKSTMFQNKSLYKKYNAIHLKQTKIREYTSIILALRLEEEVKLSLLTIKDKTLVANFTNVKKGKEKAIVKILKAKKINIKSTLKEDTLHVEIVL